MVHFPYWDPETQTEVAEQGCNHKQKYKLIKKYYIRRFKKKKLIDFRRSLCCWSAVAVCCMAVSVGKIRFL